jgi:hypothetical protein
MIFLSFLLAVRLLAGATKLRLVVVPSRRRGVQAIVCMQLHTAWMRAAVGNSSVI